MRLKILFSAKGSFFLPWRYPELLMGLFYRWLNGGNLTLGMHLHQVGWISQGHRYKPYTFSWLRSRHTQATREGIRFEPPVEWQVSSPLAALIEAFLQGIWKEPLVSLGQACLHAEQVEVLPEPLPRQSPIQLQTLSPITISTMEVEEKTGKKRKVFLSPDSPSFGRAIGESLCRKAEALQLQVPDPEVYIVPLRMRSRLITLHHTHIKAYEGSFLFEGPLSLFRLGYQAGFGERTGQGFGMVEVIPSSKLKTIP